MIEFDDWSIVDLREQTHFYNAVGQQPYCRGIMSKRRDDGHHSTGCPFYKVSGQSRGK